MNLGEAGFDATQRSHLKPFVDELMTRDLSDVNSIKAWLLDQSVFAEHVSEASSRLYVEMTCHTDDEDAKQAYLDFVENVEPWLSEIGDALNKRLINSPLIGELDAATYGVMIRDARADIDIFREENIPLQTENSKLGQQYNELCGAMMVEFEGEERTLQQMSKILEETDRERREAAWRVAADRRLVDSEKVDGIFDKLLANRHQIAKNSGFENYRDYIFVAKHRFDYSPLDCQAFHDAAAKCCIPLQHQLDADRKENLSLPNLRPWDMGVDTAGREPLRPFENVEDMVDGTSKMFHRMSTKFGEMFDTLRDGQSLDLDSRKGKAPGGYQVQFDLIRKPFIFMNATGMQRDLETMVHESGHAFHSMLSANLPLIDHREPPIEFAEVASMSMELLTHDYLDEFYSDEEANRARREHLEGIISLLPWVATIDAFQHWLYTHPGHSRAERTATWRSLRKRFGADVDWTGLTDHSDIAWQRQLHLFSYPFYYIEYGIAQLGALQLWLQWLESESMALENYENAMSLGGMVPLPELFSAANLVFDFGPITVQRLIDVVQKKLEFLPA